MQDDHATEDLIPLLGVRESDLPERALVVGDPYRAEAAAELLDDAVAAGRNREYWTFVGTYGGEKVAVVSHGVGGAGAAVCFEELCRAGVKRIIRAGTAGGLQDHLGDGDIVVASAAVRDDGVTERIVPLRYPAVSNLDVVSDLRSAAANRSQKIDIGIVLTSDIFYAHPVLGSNLELWQGAGVIAVEMECSVLLVIAAQHGVEAGAILALDGNPLASGDDDMSEYDPHRDVVRNAVDTMLNVALDALVRR